ncbi:MAG: hypothetical protein JL50_10340 [Peptococcaceae bacterium BICA1-7]|nr:MAG: hypothetical protein JL50_10340 [Peptococcaceae bacterium BICA1-7]HBV95681.1 hypothetical protein [Desulfotomaculum sp.]
MDRIKRGTPVIFNYLAGQNKYSIVTDKTGCPSAYFRLWPDSGLIVPYDQDSSAHLPKSK